MSATVRRRRGAQEARGAGAVLDIGGMDQRLDDQSQRIDEQMAFAPRELLGPIIAVRTTALGRLDRLTVEDSGARRRQSPSLLADAFS
jgi:hypothetical protein